MCLPCLGKEKKFQSFRNSQTFKISFCTASFGIFITYCTYKDYTSIEASKSKKFYSIFSVYTNGRILIDLKQPDHAITCINGLKVLSMLSIVFFHAIQTVMYETGVLSDTYYQRLGFRLLMSIAIFPTDTFFVLSGFLSVKSFLQDENT